MTILTTERDIKQEKDVAARLGKAWGVIFRKYGFFDTLEWWIEKNDRYYGVAELKSRRCLPSTYPTIYLAQRKYVAMQIAKMRGGLGYFVVKFDDNSIWYIEIGDIPAENQWHIRGRKDRPGVSPNDMEPVLEVPISSMTRTEDIDANGV